MSLKTIKYPRLILLLAMMVLSYLLFQLNIFKEIAETLNTHGYFSILLAGLLFSYGFTTPLAIGFFVTLAPEVNPFLAAPLAALGALTADLIIFEWIRSDFQDEFNRLSMTRIFRGLAVLFHRHIKETLKPYFLWTCAGLIIASPLPDEFGVSLISGFTRINERKFMILSYLFNMTGIFVILLMAR